MAAIGYVLTAASTLLGYQGGQDEAEQQQEQAEKENQFAQERAEQIEKEGIKDYQSILSSGADVEKSFRKGAESRRGTNILNIARSGVMLEGSPLQVMNEIALETEREALGIRTDAQTQAESRKYQSQLEARSLRVRGASALDQASFNKTQSLYSGAGTLLQGAGTAYDVYNKSNYFSGSKVS